jgi:cytochrome b6-f complex subunit 7
LRRIAFRRDLNGRDRCASTMASEIFGTAAIFWVLIPIGLVGGALLLKLEGD